MSNRDWFKAARDFSVISTEITGTTGGGFILGYLLSKTLHLEQWIYGITVPVGLFLGIYRVSQWINRTK